MSKKGQVVLHQHIGEDNLCSYRFSRQSLDSPSSMGEEVAFYIVCNRNLL